MTELAKVNTNGPPVRCGMCGGRTAFEPPRAIHCNRCSWTSMDDRHAHWVQRLRVALAVPARKWWLHSSPLSGAWGAWYRARARRRHRLGGHVWDHQGRRCDWCGYRR